MDPNKLTQKSQEALHDAQTKALRFGHTEVDVDHLLLALLDQADGLVPRLLERAEIEAGAELPPLNEIEENLEKLRRDRERLGAVNLRAEEELREVETQHTGLTTERDDLVEAIEMPERSFAVGFMWHPEELRDGAPFRALAAAAAATKTPAVP